MDYEYMPFSTQCCSSQSDKERAKLHNDLQVLRENDDILLLFFRRSESTVYDLLVTTKKRLKRWVRKQMKTQKGTRRTGPCLLQLPSEEKEDRHWVLTQEVWRESILPHCRSLRRLYYEHSSTDNDPISEGRLYRDWQLSELQSSNHTTMNGLWHRIHYWVSDLLDLKQSNENKTSTKGKKLTRKKTLPIQERLQMMLVGYDTPGYISSFYILSEGEAKFLLAQVMTNGETTCGDEWKDTLIKASSKHHLCSSHGLAPILLEAFGIEHNFQCQNNFRKRKAEWIESRSLHINKAERSGSPDKS